ncbi:hypothetical protein V5F31_08235 [Xanthobacter sp. V7C-4]|uniref:hypothetical protein n=1 Tax=Xanthobacter autotrophicus (strain ATCC BAA-1158 / Py2) TaxID=78245 RepID=UPI0037270650
MTFLDATPAEIATASGIDGLGANEAQAAFLAHFDRSRVSGWLSGATTPPSASNGAEPGYFRYLVLTALVSATEDGAGENKNFRDRLGKLLKADGSFNSVSGVNDLWRALDDWCKHKRAAGEPYRRVVLPSSYGNANLIGYAVRMAFPSWKDRSALTGILRALQPAVRRSPVRLTQELTRSHHAETLPQALAEALRDFQDAVRAGNRMLLGHRFWRLVENIDARLSDEDRSGREGRWRLELRFEGYELDLVRLTLFRGGDVQNRVPSWEGALQDLEARPRATLPRALAEALDQGVLVLFEAPGLTWVADDESLPEDVFAMLIARDDSNARRWRLDTTWHPLEGSWSRSGRLDGVALSGLRKSLGLEPMDTARLVDLTLEGGVRTDRTAWLGRPRLLPTVQASPTSTLSVDPIQSAEGVLTADGRAPSWDLVANGPLSGRWRLRVIEGANETEKIVCFEPAARERWEFPELGDDFEAERDVAEVNASPRKPRSGGERIAEFPPALDHVLEAVYAGPSKGWPEADLIPLLEPAMPCKHFVWDFLRGLAEAGWLDPFIRKSWRARVWKLRPPALRQIASDRIVVTGAIGAEARRRLGDVVAAAGGNLSFLRGVSDWAVPFPLIEGCAVEELPPKLVWPITVPERPRLQPAPSCWPLERRSERGRKLKKVWSFEDGLFLEPKDHTSNDAVRLERLERERGDDRDVFRVTGRGDSFLTSSLTTAILETYRRLRRPLFAWRNGRFQRLTRTGHLPLEIARSLVADASQTSGPVLLGDGSWTYDYPADTSNAEWVARALGSAVQFEGAGTGVDLLQGVVESRRAGSRLIWSEQYSREI